MADTIEQIKERIGVAELIREYLKLEQSGSGFKALCPFHNEKTPSFIVHPDKGFWYCFGCQKGGDVFTFLMEMEGLDFRQALLRLADKAGVELEENWKSGLKEKTQKQKILEILEQATIFFQQQLDGQPGKMIRSYLEQRGVDDSLIKIFRLGYAPGGKDWRVLLGHLERGGYSQTEIVLAGLAVEKSGKTGKPYDRFRDRIMFPVIDVAGKVIGFSARVAPGGDESSAKYINTPQTLVYDKSKALYGIYQARAAMRKENFAVVVEGNLDVIASHRAKIANVVAVSGTALTEEHAKIIKRYTDNLKLSFDMDEAGQRATKKSARTCLGEDLNVLVLTLPEGIKDVGELVQKNPESWPQIAVGGIPIVEYFFSASFKKYDANKIQDKKTIARELLNVIKDIADPLEKGYWLKKLAAGLKVEVELLMQVLEKVNSKQRGDENLKEQSGKNIPTAGVFSRSGLLQERLLWLLLSFPRELESEFDKSQKIFDGKRAEIFQKTFKVAPGSLEQENAKHETLGSLKITGNLDALSGDFSPEREWQETLNELTKERAREELKKIELDIKRAEEEGDEDAAELLVAEFERQARTVSEDES